MVSHFPSAHSGAAPAPTPLCGAMPSNANDWQKLSRRCVARVCKHEDAALYFNAPVDPSLDGLPDYLEVIKQPMDLATIIDKIERRQYRVPQLVLDDVALVWANCRQVRQDRRHSAASASDKQSQKEGPPAAAGARGARASTRLGEGEQRRSPDQTKHAPRTRRAFQTRGRGCWRRGRAQERAQAARGASARAHHAAVQAGGCAGREPPHVALLSSHASPASISGTWA